MEGDKTADNDKELTSTSTSSLAMGKLLSTNKEEKSDSNDTLPTSSTDASTSIKSIHSVSDDPISSTSSDMEVSKPKPNDNLSTEVLDSVSANFDTEAELLEMSITTQPSEKIEENVDDLVNDLETLLGESTDTFTVSSKSTETKEVKNDVTSAFQEELASLLGDKPENEVSSNTGVTTDKIDVLEETTDTIVLDKNELNIDKNICEKALESDANTKLEEKELTNVNVSDGSELVSDAEIKNLVSGNSSSDNCISQMNQKGEFENKESDETVEQVEDTVKENRENTKQSESSVSSLEPSISQVIEEEVKHVEKELPSEESTDLAIEQNQDEVKQVPEKTAVIFEEKEAPQDVENETERNQIENIQEDASVVEQTSSDENLKCLTKENMVEDRSIDKTTITDNGSNATKADEVETILGTNVNQDVGKSEELQELIKEFTEENQSKFVPVANEDNVQDEKTVHDNKSVDKNVIAVEFQDASVFDIENMEKESISENIKACEYVKEDSNTTDHPQEIADESVDLNKVDQVDTKTMVETQGDDNILKSSEVQIKETEETSKSVQDIVEGVCSPSESPDENSHISVQIVKKSSDDAEALIEHIDSVKDKVIDSAELQTPEESKPEVVSDGDNLLLNETGERIETDENQLCQELNCKADDKLQHEESTAEIEHIDDQGVKDTKETLFKDVLPDSIILPEDKDQLDNLENTFEDEEDSKSVKETSENAEEARISETKPVEEKDISKQVLGEIEITELPDDIANVIDKVDIIEVNPVVEEPEETIQSVEELEQLQNDNIEEVNEEEGDVETNQCQPEDFEIINKDMIIEEIDNEVKCQLEQEFVELNEQSLIEVKKVDPPETSDVNETPTEEVIKNDKQLDQQDSADHTVLHETSTNTKGIEEHINRESKQIEQDIMTTEDVEASETSTSVPIEDIQDDKSLQKLEKNTEDDIVIKDITKTETILDVGKAEERIDTVTEVNKLEPSKEFENMEIINEIPASETSTVTERKELTEVVKPVPEINIRRKTVEQDLEKVVCLSEESSDSDTNEPVISLPKITEDKYDEESNLIKIAGEVDQFPDAELPCVEALPEIEDILSVQPPVISSAASVDPSSNLETILAVASLQNESIPDVRVERRLSEKEIREMEAIRMAVASITDSSQDTYDSYLVDNSVALENSIQEISNSPEFASEVPAISSEPSISTEGIVEDNSLLTNSCTEIQEQMLIDKCVIIPENDKTEDDVCKLISHEEVSISSQNQADVVDDKCAKNFVSGELDEKLVPASDNVEKVQSITSTEDSETVDNIESQKNDEIIEEKLVDGFKEKSQDSEIQLSLKSILENVNQSFETSESEGSLQKLEQRIVENDTKSITDREIVLTNQISSIHEEVEKEKVPLLEVISKEDSTSISKNIVKENEESFSKDIDNDVTVHKEAIKDNKISEDTEEANEITLSEQLAEEKDAPTLDESAEEKSEVEGRPLRSRTRRGNKISEPLSINVEDVDKKEKIYSPKITIKPVKVPDEEVSTTSDADGSKGSLKMTITKQSDKMHSILKVYNPEDDAEAPQGQEEPIPKLIIKPKMQQVEQQHSPKMTTRSSKAYSPTSTRCSSPRVTIKPVAKPTETKNEVLSPLKITFKPVMKPEDATKKQSPKASKEQEQKNHNPKITIKPIPRPTETEKEETLTCTPKVTIKPIKKHTEENEIENEPERSSPKITIKPVIKPVEQDLDQSLNQAGPKLKIKPIKKLDDEEIGLDRDQGSPKVSIKPLVKPAELEEEEDIKKRIVLKINKGNLSTPGKDPKKREHPDDDKSEKVGIKLKFSTTGGHTHIIQEESNKRQRKDSGYSGSSGKKDIEEAPQKRSVEEKLPEKNKRLRSNLTPDKLNVENYEDLKLVEAKIGSPITLSEDSRSQHSADCVILDESNPSCADISKIADIASRTTYIEASPILTVGVATPTVNPPPKRRGRPRKVPLEIREELRDPPTIQSTPSGTPQTTPVMEGMSTPGSDVGTPEATPSPGGRPKRSCRGQNVIATLGIKPRKPRGGGRGRGSKVNMGDREPPVLQTPVHSVQTVPMKPEKVKNKSKKKKKKSRRRSKSS